MLKHPICDGDEDRVVDLWEACSRAQPWNARHDDSALARRTPKAKIFVSIVNDEIVASVPCGGDAHRAWAYYFAEAPKHQKPASAASCWRIGKSDYVISACQKWNL